MNEAAIATEELFRITLQGIAYTFRIAEEISNGSNRLGQASDRSMLARVLSEMEDQQARGQMTNGQKKMEQIVQRGEEVVQFNILEKDLSTFQAAAQKADLVYVPVCMDETHPAGNRIFTLLLSRSDARIADNIVEVNGLNAVKDMEFIQEDAQPAQEVGRTAREDQAVPKDPTEFMTKEERINAKNTAFIEQLYREAEPINPTSPETKRKEPVKENPSVTVSNGSNRKANEMQASSRSNERIPIKERLEKVRRENAPLSPEEKERNRKNAVEKAASLEQMGGTAL